MQRPRACMGHPESNSRNNMRGTHKRKRLCGLRFLRFRLGHLAHLHNLVEDDEVAGGLCALQRGLVPQTRPDSGQHQNFFRALGMVVAGHAS
eukprot:3098023-Rhodomonas_salina.3